MATTTEQELTRFAASPEQASSIDRDEEHEVVQPVQEFSLPPVDRGKDAWLLLISAFLADGFAWGFPFAFGVLQDYYTTHEPFASDSSHAATIGTVALGILYLGGPLILSFFQRYPQYRRHSSIVGLFMSSGALAASSFATHVWQLILVQGIVWSIGASLFYYPILTYIDEWFVQRKGLAFGFMWSGAYVSGATVPYVYTWLLSRYSFGTALRAWSVIAFAVPALLLYFTKPRVPVSTSARTRPRLRHSSFRLVLTRRFLVYQACNIVQGLGYFIPSLYLTTYARSLGLAAAAATTPLVLVNVGAFVGSVTAGALVDLLEVGVVIAGISLVSAAASFLFWGFSGTAAVGLVYAFAVVYGVSAGSFASTWAGVLRDVAKAEPEEARSLLEAGPAVGLLGAGRGIGSIVSGPLSEALMGWTLAKGDGRFGYESRYGSLIVFTGVALLLGGTSFGARRLGLV